MGKVKNDVYSMPIESREHLIQQINTVFNRLQLNREEIRRATRSVTTRCQKCIEAGGRGILKTVNLLAQARTELAP